MPKTTSTRGGHPQSHNRDNVINRSVAKQVDQFFLRGIEMDDDTSSAMLGLTGEEAEAVREMRPDILEIAQGEEKKKCQVFCILPSLGSETTRRIAITGSTTFEDIVQAAYHSSECSTTTREPRLTWKLSSDNKKTPPASLGNPMQWGRALQRAHEKLSRQRKASDVEIVVGFATPQHGCKDPQDRGEYTM